MLTCIISQSVYQFINGLFIIRDLCEGPGIFTFGVHSRDVKSKMIHIMIQYQKQSVIQTLQISWHDRYNKACRVILFIIRKRLIGVMNTPPNWPKNEIRRMVYLAVWVPNGAPVYFFSAMVVFLINQLIKSQIFHFNIFFLCTSAGKRHMATITKKVRLFDGLILQGFKSPARKSK